MHWARSFLCLTEKSLGVFTQGRTEILPVGCLNRRFATPATFTSLRGGRMTMMTNVICPSCGKPFYRQPSFIRRAKGKPIFCSHACARPPRLLPSPRAVLAGRLREQHPEWTQAHIARELGVSRQAVHKWLKSIERSKRLSREDAGFAEDWSQVREGQAVRAGDSTYPQERHASRRATVQQRN